MKIVIFASKHALLSQACDANNSFPVKPAVCFIAQSQSGGSEYKHRHVSSQPNSRETSTHWSVVYLRPSQFIVVFKKRVLDVSRFFLIISSAMDRCVDIVFRGL